VPVDANPDKYRWSLPANDCAQQMFAAIRNYREAVKSAEMYPRWVRAHRCFHAFADGSSGDGSFLGRRGSKGQRAVTRNSRTATDARHAISIISQAVPAIDAIPVNTKSDSLAQVRLVKQLFDYFMERRGLGRRYYDAAVLSFKFGISWIFFDWDPFAGQPLQTPEPIGDLPQGLTAQPPVGLEGAGQNPPAPAGSLYDGGGQAVQDPRPSRQTTGDATYRARSPLDVVIDLCQSGEHDWMMVSDPMNRWELIARYPTYAEDIKKLPSVGRDDDVWASDFVLSRSKQSDTDLVRIWTLYHRRCRALPEGRMVMAVSPDCWVFDGPLPYEEVTAVPIVAGERIEGTPWFDSPIFHATGTQAAIDRALSAWITNILATGHQLVSVGDPNFEVAELSDGVSALVTKPGPVGSEPKGISLTASQAENATLVAALKQDVDGTFATNSVIRGEPDANIRSGAFAGLLVQQAVQYLNPAQYSFQRGVEAGGNHLLAILKRFADKPLIAELAGPGGEWRQQSFSKADISGIHRIYAKPGNPAEQTMAFRRSVADTLLEKNLIRTATEYLAMVSTGEPSMADEDAETEIINILRENEIMLKAAEAPQTLPQSVMGPQGPMPPPPPVAVLITDNDPLHIRKHASVLDEPSARGNPVLVKIVTQHIQAHFQQALSKPPALAAMLGQVSAAPPPPPPGPPAGPARQAAPEGSAARAGAPTPTGQRAVGARRWDSRTPTGSSSRCSTGSAPRCPGPSSASPTTA
jgi:hypothetical protein